MKRSTKLFASMLALVGTSPIASDAQAQRSPREKELRSAHCPEGQRLNSQTRKCESKAGTAEATTVQSGQPSSPATPNNSGELAQPVEAVTVDSSTSNADMQKCLDGGGTWTSGVCATAEQQCIATGGVWTSGVCIKE